MSSVQKKAEAMTKVPEPVILVEEPSLSCWTEEKNNKEPQTIVVKQEDGESRVLATQQSDSNEAEDDEEQIPPDTNLLCPNSLFDGPQRRKHSLPSLQISEGIMASQVRRLSDAGAEGGSSRPHLSRQDMTFLSTLSQLPSTAGSGRRHSVVTFSNMQPTVFGRNRRESVSGVTGSRRGSGYQGPPITDHRGSIHNLQLDIMDGIVKARKARTGSHAWMSPIIPPHTDKSHMSLQT